MMKLLGLCLLIILISQTSAHASFSAPQCSDVPIKTLTDQADVIVTGIEQSKQCKCSFSGFSLSCTKTIQASQNGKNSQTEDIFKLKYSIHLDYKCDKKDEKIISTSRQNQELKTYFLDKKIFSYQEIKQKNCTYSNKGEK